MSFIRIRILFLSIFFTLAYGASSASEFGRKQTGSATIAAGSNSVTVTIDPVCLTQSFLSFTATTDALDAENFLIGGEMTDEVTLTFSRQGSVTSNATSIKWQVVEFDRGVSVQRGVSNLTGTTLAVPISAVDLSKSFVIATMTNTGTGIGTTHGFNADLTTTTNLQLNAAAGSANFTVYWQVIEYEDADVNKYTTTLTANNTNQGITSVDEGKTMLVGNHTITGSITAVQNMPRTELTSDTNIKYTKQNGPDLTFVTYVIEFTDATTVERGGINFASGDLSNTDGITAVESSIAFGPGNFGRQGSGNSGDTNMGYQYGTFEITNSTTLTIARAISGKGFFIPWEVVTFEDSNPGNTTYYSLAGGAWDDNSSWSLTSDGSSGALAAGVWPSRGDNIVVRSGHIITVNATDDNNRCGISPIGLNRSNVASLGDPFPSQGDIMFYHTGDVIIDAGGELEFTVRSMFEGFTYVNGEFDTNTDIVNLGNLEVTATATFDTEDDLILSGNSLTIFNNSSDSDDDIYIDYTDALLCGTGAFNIGTGGSDPIIQYFNGATEAQICSSLTITCGGPGPCTGAPPTSPGNFSLGYTGPGGIAGTNGTTELVLWLDANTISQGTGTNLSTWSDQSGYSNDATSPGGNEPVYNTSQLNGFPAIQFTAANSDYMLVSDDASLEPVTISIIVVLNIESASDAIAGVLTKNNSPYNAGYQISRDAISTDIRFTINSTTNFVDGSNPYGSYVISSNIYDKVNVEQFQNEISGVPDPYTSDIAVNSNDLNIGRNVLGTDRFLDGDIAEAIIMNRNVNLAERILMSNYLSAKYNIALSANDVYEQDNSGDFDFEVAGIGQASDGTFNKDAQGTGLVRINLASDLDNNEFLMWGHDGTSIDAINTVDVDGTIIEARLDRVWRVSENDNTGTAVDVGTVRLTFDVSNSPPTIVGSDMRLLITRDDALFADNDITPQAGSYNIDNQIITFSNVDLQDGDYFTLGTTDNTTSPLPIDLISFAANPKGELVELEWVTASELNNDYFTIERSVNAQDWENVTQIEGKGTTEKQNEYETIDDRPYSGISFYRLKQTDFDGTFTYSKIVSVQLEKEDDLKIYPNPSSGSFRIKTEFELTNANIVIHDLAGRRIQSNVRKEQYSAEVQINEAPAGIYILEINDGIKVYKRKVLIDY